jgi:hypothetical protein
MRKVVQVEPKQTPGDQEHRSDPIFRAVISQPTDQNAHASDETRYTNEKPETCVLQNAITVSADLENSDEL